VFISAVLCEELVVLLVGGGLDATEMGGEVVGRMGLRELVGALGCLACIFTINAESSAGMPGARLCGPGGGVCR
jgi:hypothetical protein